MEPNLNRLAAPLLTFMLVATAARAQSVNLIETEIDELRKGLFELGPFQATPVFRFSTGYDSNALSTPDPQQDVSAMVGPGIYLGLPFGSKAFLDMFQELDYVWYRDHVDLRRIERQTRRQALEDRRQTRPVGFAGRQETEFHASPPAVSKRAAVHRG